MISDVIRKGSYYQTLDQNNKKINEVHESRVGVFKNTAGDTMNFLKGNYIATYDVNFKKISERRI